MIIKRGTLVSFDATTYTASVKLVGSQTLLKSVPVNKAIKAYQMFANNEVSIVFHDETNPSDSILVAVFGDAPDSVEHHTADDTLTLAESGSIHTNLGEDGAMTLTLPASAPEGTTFTFTVLTAQELRVEISAASKSFYAVAAKTTDDGGADLYIAANAIGSTATFVADGNGDWLVSSMFRADNDDWGLTQP